MREAREVGVVAAVTVGDTIASSRWCVGAANAHQDVYAAVAVHPTEIAGLDDDGYAELEELARDPRVVAVGETGLDYYWDRTEPADQQQHFRRHIELAKATGKALMIHDREAHADVLRILREEGAPEHVVLHAFSGDAEHGPRVRRGRLRALVPGRDHVQERAGAARGGRGGADRPGAGRDRRAVPDPASVPRPAERAAAAATHRARLWRPRPGTTWTSCARPSPRPERGFSGSPASDVAAFTQCLADE